MVKASKEARDAQIAQNKTIQQSTLSFKAGQAAAKAFALALNLLAAFLITKSIELFVKALDNSADSLADVEARIQENQDALSDYTSKIEELTEKLEDLNNTDTTYFSDARKAELNTETAYVQSQIKLYHQLAEAKQKAINDDYIKAAAGENEELFLKKAWNELYNGEWSDLASTVSEQKNRQWLNLLFPGLGLIGTVDDGNYISKADKLLDEYEKLQDKYISLQHFAVKNENNEALTQKLESAKSQMTQTSAALAQSIEELQTARDSLANSSNKDEYFDIINELDQAIADYQEALSGNVYASEYVGFSDLQRDLIGIRDVIQVIAADLDHSPIFEPLAENINHLIELIGLLESYSFSEILDTLFFEDRLNQINDYIQKLKETINSREFSDQFKSRLSEAIPSELLEKLNEFQNGIESTSDRISLLIQRIGNETGLSALLNGLKDRLRDISGIFSYFIEKYGFLFGDAVNAWNEAHQVKYTNYDENETNSENGAQTSGTSLSFDAFTLKDAENNLTALGKASEAIDNIQNACKTLSAAIDEYNSSGALSIDTLQSVIGLGDDWLDYLVDENGALKLDQSALEALTQSRLEDMRVQTLNNVIDSVKQIENNADAHQYLASANYKAADSFEELALSSAIATKELLANRVASGDISQAYYDAVIAKMYGDIDKINALFDHTTANAPDTSAAVLSACQAFTDILDQELDVLDQKMETGYMDFNDYIATRLSLIESYYRQGKLSADEYYSYLENHYETQLSYMDKVVNAVTRRIDREIDALEKQRSAIEDSYQEQIDFLEEQKTLLQEANQERERQLNLQKSLYELERAQNQRTTLLYSEGRGMHYVADEDAIREAQREVEAAELEIETAKIESAISELEKARDRETAAIDEMISKLQEYREQWNDITSAYEEEQENLIAAQILGQEWEQDILDGRLDTLIKFKDDYIAIQQAMTDAAYQAAQAMANAEKVTITDTSKEKLSGLSNNSDSTAASPQRSHNSSGLLLASTSETAPEHLLPLSSDDPAIQMSQKLATVTGSNINFVLEDNVLRQMNDTLTKMAGSVTNYNANMREIRQEFHISLPNVTDHTTAVNLLNDLESLATKKLQAF